MLGLSYKENLKVHILSPTIPFVKTLTARKGVNVKVCDPHFTPKEIRDNLGVPPERVELYKAFFGDKSDDIPGVPRIRRKCLNPLLLASANVQEVYDNLFSANFTQLKLSKNEVRKLQEYREQVEENFKVVQLRRSVDYKEYEMPGQENILRELLVEIDCPSLLPEIDIFFR